MENKLTPLSDYVLELCNKAEKHEDYYIYKIVEYTKFLKQKLSDRYNVNGVNAHPLNRFVPCDLDGNVLKELVGNFSDVARNNNVIGKAICSYCGDSTSLNMHEMGRCGCANKLEKYQEAKERVVFDGVEVLSFKDFGEWIELTVKKGSEGVTFNTKNRTIENLMSFQILTLTETGCKLAGKEFER